MLLKAATEGLASSEGSMLKKKAAMWCMLCVPGGFIDTREFVL